MPQLIEYLVKLSGTLMVLYLFYRIALRPITFYTANRWYLLGYSIAAFFLPFINIHPLLETAQLENDRFVQWVPVIAPGIDHSSPVQVSDLSRYTEDIVFALFVTGMVLLAIRFIIRYYSVRLVRKGSRLLSEGDVKVYHSDRNIIPFSFGKSIFINKYKHSEDDLREIIRHEFIHVKQNHTVDILLGEWLCILNWYNPFAWLIRNAIRQNLEFIADNKVLQNGVDKKEYQYLLLKVVGVHQYGIATNFNFTSLKKRIAMMNKIRSARVHCLKFLFVLPLLVVILLAFRNKLDSKGMYQDTISGALILTDQPINNTTIGDTIPSPKKPSANPRQPYVAKPNSKGYIITVADNHGECIVIVRDKQNKIVKAVSLVDWDENEKQYKSEYGEIPPVPTVSAAEPQKSKIPNAPEPSAAPVKAAMPENVHTIHVKNQELTLTLKNGETEIYDLSKPEQKATFEKKYGVIRRTPGPVPVDHPSPVIATDSDQSWEKAALGETKEDNVTLSFEVAGESILNVDSSGKVNIKTLRNFDGIIIVNDKEYDTKTFEKQIKLDASDIKSVDVLKGESARQLYGEKGKNGVIRITTKLKSD